MTEATQQQANDIANLKLDAHRLEISNTIWNYDPALRCCDCGRVYKKRGWLLRHQWNKHPRPSLAKHMTYDEWKVSNPMTIMMQHLGRQNTKNWVIA